MAITKDNRVDTCKVPCTGNWTTMPLPAQLSQVSVGDTEIWAVNMNDDIFTSTVPVSAWSGPRSIKLRNISVGKFYIYGVNSTDVSHRCLRPCTADVWQSFGGTLVHQISANLDDDAVYAVNAANNLFKLNGNIWQQISSAPQLSNVATINKNEIIGCTPTGAIRYGRVV